MPLDKITSQPSVGHTLAWLADAPLFIDADQIDRFFDAVVAPLGDEEVKLVLTKETLSRIGASINLAKLFPGINTEASAAAGSKKTEQQTITVKQIKTPQRQLVALTLHYLANQGGRYFVVKDPGNEEEWRRRDVINAAPRALAFVDLPPQMYKLLPMAMELEGKGVIEIFRKFANPMPLPADLKVGATKKEADLHAAALSGYWRWFSENVSAPQATQILEKETGKHRILWIDYRFQLTEEGKTGHLHFCPRGKYDTGTFAYNMIQRGYRQGLRVVGTVRQGPSINVLAIYEC